MTTFGRFEANACPISSSLWPCPYTSAVSKKLTPRSNARCSARSESSSCTDPQRNPPIGQPPKPISDTIMPVRPRRL
jgi:hypothetical protein